MRRLRSVRRHEAERRPGADLDHLLEHTVSTVIAIDRTHRIAETLFLSINSVKTYIRSTYRKISVTSRGPAIVWAIQHGFLTERYDEPTEG